jgi:hypothetical protein
VPRRLCDPGLVGVDQFGVVDGDEPDRLPPERPGVHRNVAEAIGSAE